MVTPTFDYYLLCLELNLRDIPSTSNQCSSNMAQPITRTRQYLEDISDEDDSDLD